MLDVFSAFLVKMKAGFNGIVAATRGEVTIEDLHQDAWILADEIAVKRGLPIDFSDPDDQSLVMRWVNFENVTKAEKTLRDAVSIDKPISTDEGELDWAGRLPGSASSDPLVELIDRENSIDYELLLTSSYSQAAAYVIVFFRFGNDRGSLCSYFLISKAVLTARTAAAAHTVRFQPSLFDRIERIKQDFMPQPGSQQQIKTTQVKFFEQSNFDF